VTSAGSASWTGLGLADGSDLAELCREASRLVAETAGPLRRLHLRRGDTVLEIEWHGGPSAGTPTRTGIPPSPPEVPADDDAGSTADPASTEPAGADVRHLVRAPMVGTFYRAPEPGAAPFVEAGDLVAPGQVVGIVEAMKLMNEVVAERAGQVSEVLVRDGEPVEFDQPLIALLPA